jgi:ferredoxin-NADP reductase
VTIPGEAQPALRTYTLSTPPNPDHYRLSIRRGEGNALVSRFLHANGKPGLRIEAMTPRGKFILAPESERPVVFVSGGVGITPMIAMANHIVEEGRRTDKFRPLWFIHGTHNGRVHAFANHIRELAREHAAMKVHIRYSQPGDADRLGTTHDGKGHITIDLLKELLPLNDYDFYLCGPPPFMQSLYDGLTGIGVRRERIHYESFGFGTALKPEFKPETSARIGETADGLVPVRFAKSGITAQWCHDSGTCSNSPRRSAWRRSSAAARASAAPAPSASSAGQSTISKSRWRRAAKTRCSCAAPSLLPPPHRAAPLPA